ncbi:MAG: hypothetical protein E7286_03505 [Lachnospiraceae bacterium]|nr:hypothetical protein [Lachnospiraceae bacterium]
MKNKEQKKKFPVELEENVLDMVNGGNCDYAGGIVGYAYDGTVIDNCLERKSSAENPISDNMMPVGAIVEA